MPMPAHTVTLETTFDVADPDDLSRVLNLAITNGLDTYEGFSTHWVGTDNAEWLAEFLAEAAPHRLR